MLNAIVLEGNTSNMNETADEEIKNMIQELDKLHQTSKNSKKLIHQKVVEELEGKKNLYGAIDDSAQFVVIHVSNDMANSHSNEIFFFDTQA